MINLSERQVKVIIFLVAATGLAFMLDLTWLRWTDMVIDSGREIYVPKALADGRLLYRDILYIYGPFSPYFNALLYKVLGVHVLTLAAGGVLNVAAAMFLVYSLAKSFLSRGYSFLVLMVFLFIYPFGIYSGVNIFNYMIPYSYPAVHSLIFSLASLYFFRRFLADDASSGKMLSAVFLFMTAITKTEIACWLSLSLLLGFFLQARGRRYGIAASLMCGLRVLAPPIVAALLVHLAFRLGAGGAVGASPDLLDLAKSNILMPRNSFAWGLFGGGEELWVAAWKSLQTFLPYAGGVGFFVGGGLCYERRSEGRAGLLFPSLAAVAGVAALAVAFFVLDASYRQFLSPLYLISLTGLALSLGGARWWGTASDRIFLAAFSLFSFLMLLRILFNTWAGSFGFYLSVPGFLLMAVLAFRVLPEIAGRWPGNLLRVAFVGTLLVVTFRYLDAERFNYAAIKAPFPTFRGTLYFWDPARVKAYRDLATVLSHPSNRGKTLVMFPEGLWMNFATGLENPLYNYQYLPIDFKSKQDFDRLIEEFEVKKPDFFVVADRSVGEYGAKTLDEYASPLREYIFSRYGLVGSFSERAVLYRRR